MIHVPEKVLTCLDVVNYQKVGELKREDGDGKLQLWITLRI